MGRTIFSVADFQGFVKEVEDRGGYRRPLAFGIGLAHVSQAENILDSFFPVPNYNANFGTAAVFAEVCGHLSGTNSYVVTLKQAEEALRYFHPFKDDEKSHPNIENLYNLIEVVGENEEDGQKLVVAFIDQPEFDEGPKTVPDAYLRLHLLSHRLVKPNGINLNGLFGVLPNNVWTNEGPIAPEDFPTRRLQASYVWQNVLKVFGVDKIPTMTDYVVPSGVRIADASRVRLGAYLSEGTTVMHEGFCNYNAGTLGSSMIEGRISQGVVVGDQSDIGGGASTMGTLSGGGKEKVSIGRGTLLGANSGIGISLGNLCVVEAGLYVTAGMRVVYNGEVVKAKELSGKDGLTFRRNGESGQVEVLDLPNKVVLNEVLHKN